MIWLLGAGIVICVVVYYFINRSKAVPAARDTKFVEGTVNDDWLIPLWEGAFDATFSHKNVKNEHVKRTVTIESVRQNLKGEIFLRGLCHLRNQERTFDVLKILTKISVDGKKYDVKEYLKDILRIDIDALHPRIIKRRNEEKERVHTWLTPIWQGDAIDVYFRYCENENIEAQRCNIKLTEVGLVKSGAPFFVDERPERLFVYDARKFESEIYYKNNYYSMLDFLISILNIQPHTLGITTLWNGEKNILLTYDNGYGKKYAKIPMILGHIAKGSDKIVYFACSREGQDEASFIPAFQITSVFIDEKRRGPEKFLTEVLELDKRDLW